MLTETIKLQQDIENNVDESQIDDTAEKAHEFISGLMENANGKRILSSRGNKAILAIKN